MLQGEAPPLEYIGEYEIRGRAAKMKIWAPSLPKPATDERIGAWTQST